MPQGARILDLGTGTGAIAVTLLAERPDASAVATDISPAALAVAAENAERAGVAERLVLTQGSWFEPVTGVFDIIVSNPPYIPAGDIAALSPDVRNFDPILALVGGEDGLDPYRAISASAAGHLAKAGHVLVEIGAGQADEVEAIFAALGFGSPERHKDLGGHLRCLAFCHSR
jgi:release factor glutamine methyltransferase